VKIYQKGKEFAITTTYAFYDNGSSGCFLTENIMDSIGATGAQTMLQLRTMHGRSCVRSAAIQDLVITDLNGQNPVEIPKAYTRDEIPVNSRQIPRPEIIEKWKHLKQVANEIPAYRPDLDIGILISSNCPAALEPLDVIPMERTGPFAIRLRHGWTICGPLEVTSTSNTDEISANRIMIQEVESFKEIMTPASVLHMFEKDFNDHKVEKYPNERGLSQEDLIFMDRAEQEIVFKDDHYTLPLHFREECVEMPNNREVAMKRLSWQRKKMTKDDKYHADYVGFINKILDKGYAQRVPDTPLQPSHGSVWYLPHHGVYNPHKPDKIRVVFDCSAKYKGTCLNDRLLQGPDLTTRFRQEPIAFMADIEAMFYQVRVPEKQRDFLRFFWWPNGDLSSEVREYQMNVHLFDAVSSASIANYALKQTGKHATDTLVCQTIQRDFYVDDCLKAVESYEVVIRLVESLQTACADGGFHLTKFTSNSPDVMRSIPRGKYSKEMMTKNLDYDDLPAKKICQKGSVPAKAG
jgi:hypothetical protein